MNTNTKAFLYFNGLILSILLGCSNSETKTDTGDENVQNTSELQKKINLDTIPSIQLQENASKVTEEWMMHIALNSEMERLADYNLVDILNNAESIDRVVDSLAISVPEVFETNAVKARIITLKTHSKLLLEHSKRTEPKPKEVEKLAAKLKLDFNNLNIQLNEVFILEENPIDFSTDSI